MRYFPFSPGVNLLGAEHNQQIVLSVQLTSVNLCESVPGALLGSGQGGESKDDVILSQDAFCLLRGNK